MRNLKSFPGSFLLYLKRKYLQVFSNLSLLLETLTVTARAGDRVIEVVPA